MQAVADLAAERARPSFDVRALSELLMGGKERQAMRERIFNLVESDPVFRHDLSLSQPEFFKRACEKAVRLFEITKTHDINSPEELMALRVAVGHALPTDLHENMFTFTLLGQATDEQQAKWLPLAIDYKILGCYAQTEIGHGSNVQGLETVAVYDKDTQEFVVHSPTLTSIKAWPGTLGRMATHAMVFARLVVNDTDHGPHPFIVPIRSMSDHSTLPGVEVGDMGPKMGFNGIDNGYLRMTHVRIPRENMMMRYAKVLADGTYERPPHSKLSYGVMITIRARLVFGASFTLQKALVIAIRYSAVRRQFGGSKQSHGLETKVLDYRMQQHRLFPLLATAFAFQFTGFYMQRVYNELQSALQKGEFDELGQVHATSSGLKAITTARTSEGIEQCRMCCGGHGFLQSSGLPAMYAEYVPACTYEGENYVMLQQTARYLTKCLAQAASGQKLDGFVSYLNDLQGLSTQRSVPENLTQKTSAYALAAFRHCALRLVVRAGTRLQKLTRSMADDTAAWNACVVDLVTAAKAHCHLVLVANFWEFVEKLPAGPVRAVLDKLAQIYALSLIVETSGNFTADGFLSAEELFAVQERLESLYDAIRPDAVPLVDSFGHSDYALRNSVLGRYDGDVYTALYRSFQEAPLNQPKNAAEVDELVRPILNGDALRLAQAGAARLNARL